MKQTHKTILFVILIIFTLSACHKRTLVPDFDEYSRVADFSGKKIIFLNNYNFDTQNEDTLFILDIPPYALDSSVIFNLYQFKNENLYYELFEELSIEQETHFIYFLIFYNQYTNIDTDYDDISYHLSIDFNKPVVSTFYIDKYLDANMKFYRIKIPKYNEWGNDNNIRVDTNYQAFPHGFYELDLVYLINGKWTENNEWGQGEYSINNWEEVTEYTYNQDNKSITFEINNTDYMYVIVE